MGGGGLRPQLLYFRINWINVYRKLTNVAQNVRKVASKNLKKPKVAENSKSCQNSKKLPKISKVAEKLPSNLWLSLAGRKELLPAKILQNPTLWPEQENWATLIPTSSPRPFGYFSKWKMSNREGPGAEVAPIHERARSFWPETVLRTRAFHFRTDWLDRPDWTQMESDVSF